jgi:hypothetical protein
MKSMEVVEGEEMERSRIKCWETCAHQSAGSGENFGCFLERGKFSMAFGEYFMLLFMAGDGNKSEN